ncbi:iron ABC transporter ATP-binding protein [Leifsonia aquatica]|uniref:iron ABC transporter ATP-binding protein n=1 Tax=Leifsonia aquatica TaxID=144185 RepID=UPI0028AEAAC8|nr:iron ABC transporter ATP-binding protein [Leifsonia aquatica]
MPFTARSALRTVTVAAALIGALALAGCAPTATSPSSSPTGTAGGGAATTKPTVTPTPTEPPTPVTLTCDQLVTPDQIYAFNPNFGTSPGYQPKDGTLEKKVADWQGLTCAWLNQTSGDVIQIAVAQPPASQLDGLKNAAITDSQPVPTYGAPPIEGYFKTGESGQVQIFRGGYWIVAESTAFFEPGDAAPLMENVLGNLPAS